MSTFSKAHLCWWKLVFFSWLLKIRASYLIITIWRILMIFIWIIMYTHRKRNLLEQLGSGTFPAACLFTCTCFCRIPDKVLTARRWIPASQSPLANCSVWLCGFPDWPVFPLKPEQTETMGFDGPDQRPCSKTSPYGACPRCGSLRLTRFATGFHFNNRPWTRGLGVKSFNPRLEKITESVFASWYCYTTFFATEAEREEYIFL